jgi:hypothetical protein
MSGRVELVLDGRLVPAGYQQITDVSASVGLTVPTGSVLALVQAQDQAVRWRDDGTDPTGTVGMVLSAGETLVYNGDLSAIEFIETAASA